MRIAYLVLVHHKPEQFARLAHTLLAGGNAVLVHVDASADEKAFRRVVAGTEVGFLGRRRTIRWGNFSVVRAELDLLREATRHRTADHYVLLSGADYPIRPEQELLAELESGATYLNSWRMPNRRMGKPLARLEYFNVAAKNRSSRTAKTINRLLRRLPKRNISRGLGGLQPYGGSHWWVLPHDVAVQVLRFADSHPRFVRFFSRSRCPDEMFFQTIVEALPDARDVRPSLTFTDWSRAEVDGSSPATLTSADVPLLRSQPHFFARKFDLGRDPHVLDAIDRELLAGTDSEGLNRDSAATGHDSGSEPT